MLMHNLLEHKDFVGSIKDVDTSGRRVTGFLTAFGNEDNDKDTATKGMFAKTIAENGPQGANTIFFLNHHDWKQPHGKFSVLEEKDEGLYFESEKLPNTSYSNDVLELYKEGIIKEHSYGFIATKAIGKKNVKRTLKEVRLFEGSNVTLGANNKTRFTGFKSLSITQINEKSSAIMKMLRSGNLTDDTFMQLEIALKQLQMEAFELGKNSTQPEPDPSTQQNYEPLITTIKSFTQNLN